MATVSESTRIGSFRGVEFYTDSVTTTEGSNRANYLYINAKRRISKNLGEYPADFSFQCFTYSTDGDEYKQNRDRLRQVLKDGNKGTLVHPTLGEFFGCAGKYSFTEDERDRNRCVFEIPFYVCEKDSDDPLTPAGQLVNSAQIKKQALVANESLQAAVNEAFVANTAINKDVNKSFLSSIGDSLGGAFGSIGDSIAQANEYADKALDISEQASFYANNPIIGFAAISDLLLGVDGLTLDTFAKFKKFQTLFNFGNAGDDNDVNVVSPQRINPNPATIEDAERKTNSEITKTFMQTGCLIEAYAQAGNYEFATDEEVDEFDGILETQFINVSEFLTASEDDEIFNFRLPQPDYSDTYAELKILRENLKIYFDEQRSTAAKVITIDVNPMPTSVLSYYLYGDSTRRDEISELNNLIDNMVISGTIKVLSR